MFNNMQRLNCHLKINHNTHHGQRIKTVHNVAIRWIIWLIVFSFMIFIYLTNNCWPNIFGYIFGNNQRHDFLEYLSQQQYHGNVPLRKYAPYGNIRSRLPSLIIRPLNSSFKSIIARNLTAKKLEQLFKVTMTNHTMMQRENLLNCSDKKLWDGHKESYKKRRLRLKKICQRYRFMNRIFNSWHLITNRRLFNHFKKTNNHKYCNTRNCPLLVNADHQLLTCFVQKVASTSIKHLYLYLLNHNQTNDNDRKNLTFEQLKPIDNLTDFHFRVNQELYRISPTYLAYSKETNYFKILFVRHPFVRVVSAFKDKAEKTPEKETYFYEHYWNPLLDRLYGKQRDPNRHVTFREFVEELLLTTDPYKYDEHWAPIWTRCEPCFIHYDFIGKLETGDEDFRILKTLFNPTLINVTIWENFNPQTFGQNNDKKTLKSCQWRRLKYAETIKYLSELSPQTLIELYKRYYLDFELFGYTIEELFETVKW